MFFQDPFSPTTENCSHLFSGAHIGHSLSDSAYPSKQLQNKDNEKIGHDFERSKITWKSKCAAHAALTFGEMSAGTRNVQPAGPKVGNRRCILHLGISLHW